MNRGKLKEILYILPLALIIGVTPLIVHYKKIKLGKVVASYWIRDINTDFFSYYKMWAFLIFVLLALVSFYIYIKKEKELKKTFYYIPIAVYMLMIVISTVFSECKLTSLSGFPDRYEGMPVLLGYMLLVIITINLVKTKRQIKFLLSILLISAVIIGVIGLFQFFGMDFFQSYVAQRIMLPAKGYQQIVSRLNFRFDDRNIIYATFYNPNYVGSYFVMLFMLTFVMYFFSEAGKEKVIYGTINLLMYANWLGSLSRAGIIGSLFSFLLLFILLRVEIKRRWKSLVIIFICFAIVFTFMDIYTDGKLKREFMSLGEETKLAIEGKPAKIRDIRTEEGSLIFATEENTLKIGFNEYHRIEFKDAEDNGLMYHLENQEKSNNKLIYIKDERYKNFTFRLINIDKSDNKFFELHYGKKQANYLVDTKSNKFLIFGMRGNIYPIEKVENWGFEDKEGFASDRGYIWSRSLPLLKNTIWKGFGPDTYAIYFPQHDAVGKIKAFSTASKIVDKPHNMYLQMALNTGLISAVAIIIMFAVYFVRSFKIYWSNSYDSWLARAGIGVFVSFTGYAVAGLFNDSVISVAPVFWTLLGIGFLIELKLRDKKIIKYN